MKPVALSYFTCLAVISSGCTNMTVEEVGSFKLNGETYVIKSTTPGRTPEANAREQATYSVKVKGGTATCDGSTSDCRTATERKIRELESDEGAYG